MFVIAVYDISTIKNNGQRRLVQVMKIMRKYLHHTQKSVFEGEITESKIFLLKNEIKAIISDVDDYVVFYCNNDSKYLKRETLGKSFDPNDVII